MVTIVKRNNFVHGMFFRVCFEHACASVAAVIKLSTPVSLHISCPD